MTPGTAGYFHWLRDLNALYRGCEVLYRNDTRPDCFEWIDCLDTEHSVIAFMRRGEGETPLVFICNFTPVAREDFRLGLQDGGYYREVFNSDAEVYGGSGVGNGGKVATEVVSHHGRPHSALLRLPPLVGLVLGLIEA